jgi:hypothetical protein
LINLIKLAMQALKQLTRSLAGSHPEVARKRHERVTPEQREAYADAYTNLGSYLT